MDPGNVPKELACLSPIEIQLVAAVHPVISVYRVNGQQYAYLSQVINFPQDVAELVTHLPYHASTLSSILVVRRGTAERHSDFNVNRQKIAEVVADQ